MDSPTMPPLVDHPHFMTPPQGATNGGQPGLFGGPGTGNNFSSPWPRNGTPHPSWPISPAQPTSASSWTYGYTPWGPPPPASHPSPAWGQTPVPSRGTSTPGGTWGAPSPAASWGPQTPAAYSPWVSPHQQHQQNQQGGTWITPNMTKPPASPHDATAGMAFNAPLLGAEGNASYTGYPEGLGGGPPPVTPKKHRSSKRHHSKRGRSPTRPPLYRSTSWGEETQEAPVYPSGRLFDVPAYAKGDAFDERNLARRPLDWRPDYKTRLASYIPGLPKNRTEVTEYIDSIRRTLHPLLHFTHNSPPVYHNLLESPFHTSSIEFSNLSRPHNEIDFAQLACQPSTSFLRLVHPRLPWYVDIHQVHPNGVTVLDVLAQMHIQLHTKIQPRHFYNEELTDADRAEITKAFHTRCKGDTLLMAKGILQVDFLGDKVVFEGLSRAAKGLFEIKLSRDRF